MSRREKVCAIIAAGGSSRRMGGADKIMAMVGGKPVIVRVIETFQSCELVDRIVVVLAPQNVRSCARLIYGPEWPKVSDVCPGGERRQDSVAAGLVKSEGCQWVIVQDGARPLVTHDLIRRGLEAARETGAAAAAVPVTDTVKIAGPDMIVKDTPPRQSLWAAQTPQVFRYDIITAAYRNMKDDVTDDASLVEQSGHRVKLYMGSYDNIKITGPDDIALAEALLKKRVR